MASIRTARALAGVASLPLAAALFTGVASADNGAFASDGSNAGVAAIGSAGVGGDNSGNSSTSQQQAVGAGASNHSNSAQVIGSPFAYIDQSTRIVHVTFTPLWVN
ncbi:MULTISPECIES: hypothetical protein [Streptomyces]|uniref:Secreted protein n=1 Tax=Streptomyces mutomycini TaxID=284036 RepID=A0ABW0B5H2_9ACTN|nr:MULTISPECIES: hypothetical protein [Streptomyces]KPC82348.1 hypothetical protein ADK82_13700 [Streptomyces sp. NRRL S-4]